MTKAGRRAFVGSALAGRRACLAARSLTAPDLHAQNTFEHTRGVEPQDEA